MTTKELEHQVAGHKGVQTDDSGELVYKPALPTEIAFYEHVAQNADSLGQLRPFMPVCYGKLTLQGEQDGEGGVREVADTGSESIVLENLTYGYLHPSVLDAKLGTVLYDENATEEKKARMIKKAAETTTGQVGLRLTGCQPSQSYISTPRQFGYDLKVADMPAALARFFPLPSDTIQEYIDPSAQPSTATSTSDPSFTEPTLEPKSYSSHAIPLPLLSRLLSTLLARLEKLRSALDTAEIRAVGASLLVIYESDPTRLAECFTALDQGRVKWKEDAEIDPDADSDEEDDDEETPLPISLHLIDFAHTFARPGEGPDPGVLMGLDKFTELVRGRLEDVRKAQDGSEEDGGEEREAKKAKTG
ncbi:hypothetical protein A1Q2_00471 [Trichosporon asahii var. asahii CBS 8904]|uniref:Kinase n=1 Tax=Trichosporon asahii var. asahii (strain CBS 8904) TaxID=1220162 RepID=K1VXJ3_TRIAC|nr:hypothetical protein A1Q2_00471 [Trichosporon asahii var. asahii CBS 8904]